MRAQEGRRPTAGARSGGGADARPPQRRERRRSRRSETKQTCANREKVAVPERQAARAKQVLGAQARFAARNDCGQSDESSCAGTCTRRFSLARLREDSGKTCPRVPRDDYQRTSIACLAGKARTWARFSLQRI